MAAFSFEVTMELLNSFRWAKVYSHTAYIRGDSTVGLHVTCQSMIVNIVGQTPQNLLCSSLQCPTLCNAISAPEYRHAPPMAIDRLVLLC